MNSAIQRNPVLLVHGISDTTTVFNSMSAYLAQKGWRVHSFNLTPNNGSMGLERLAAQVTDYIDRNFAPNQPIDLVGFSMGGIVTRYYLQRLGGIERVQRYINISAPNNGTVVGYLSWHLGCAQMRPGSPLLDDLNQDVAETLGRIQVTYIWTPMDLMIFPAHSSQLPVGKEVILPVPLHSLMLSDSRSLKAVEAALSEPIAAQGRKLEVGEALVRSDRP
ncbi:MAG: triacylglycerol lipase [Kastovskya adunca ATA6-11-RM4]|jgi:triacylglycerol lipase|nr:triacylglycerol lipase [Kastovskya adunca ATA6-11-RM4]